MNRLIGYFDDAQQTEPTYDPGTGAHCLVCYQPLCPPVKTISLMPRGGPRSYFFRTHKACWENLSEEERASYESSIIDWQPVTATREEG